jgi:hypothetical protein
VAPVRSGTHIDTSHNKSMEVVVTDIALVTGV